jgi:hypothetical protein
MAEKNLLCSNECGPSIIIIAASGVGKEIVALLVHVEDGLEVNLLAHPCVTGAGMLQSFFVGNRRVLPFCIREYTGHSAVLRDELSFVIGGIEAYYARRALRLLCCRDTPSRSFLLPPIATVQLVVGFRP